MEQHLQQLQRFVISPLCMFDFKPIDYPSAFQQHLIAAYFQFVALVKSTAHPDMIRILHSSTEKQLEIFLPGLLYSLFLDFKEANQIFQTYMPILRGESWLALDRLLQQLIKESFTSIKNQHKSALIHIMNRLNYFRQLSVDLLTMAIKIIDAFDFSEHSLNFNNNLLEFFESILAQGAETDHLKAVLADRFFYKLLRMLTLLNTVDEEIVRDYRSRCVAIAYRLLTFGRERCVAMGWGASGVMRQLENDQNMQKLLQECRQELLRSPPPPENPAVASMRLGMVLPIRIESTVRFIIKQQISQVEIGVQMNWAFGKGDSQLQLLLIDILRYILALPSQQLPGKQCLYLLEWLFYRSCSNNILFQFWKSQLFHPCFCDPCPYPAAPQRALRFLAYLLQSNFQFGQTLFIYLLRQMSVPGYVKRLRQLLIQADTLQILDLQALLTRSRLSPRAKAELRAAVGDDSSVEVQRFKEEQAQPYYNLLQELPRKDSEMQVQFSSSQESMHFDDYDQHQAVEEEAVEQDTGMRVKVQKMFAQDLGQNLARFLMEPKMANYKQLLRKLMDEIKSFKMSGEVQTIQMFISETAKLSYILFQNQFEDHSAAFPREENVITHLLGIVAAQWRTNSLFGQCTKKIIRKIIDYFPTAEAGIWRQFLLHFKRGVVPQAKDLKDWLIPKEKAEYAMALLRQLGPLSKDLVENAQQLKLPL